MKYQRRPGIALFLVMSIIFVVLTSVVIGSAVILKSLDSRGSTQQAEQARVSATTGIERVRGWAVTDSQLFNGCTAGDCFDIGVGSCAVCSDATITAAGNLRYQVKINTVSDNAVSVVSTGFRGPYTHTANAVIAIDHCGESILDRDDFEYTTARIGDQCWMTQSLRTKSKPDGTCINDGLTPPCPDASSDDNNDGRSCYDDSEGRCEVEGALYTWDAAMNGSTTSGAQGLCPDGWHVPTDAEWHTLENGLTGELDTCDPNRIDTLDCVPAGTSLQISGGSLFEAALAGWRSGGKTFEERGNMVWFWTSTAASGAQVRRLDSGQTAVYRLDITPTQNLSLRCIMNE